MDKHGCFSSYARQKSAFSLFLPWPSVCECLVEDLLIFCLVRSQLSDVLSLLLFAVASVLSVHIHAVVVIRSPAAIYLCAGAALHLRLSLH